MSPPALPAPHAECPLQSTVLGCIPAMLTAPTRVPGVSILGSCPERRLPGLLLPLGSHVLLSHRLQAPATLPAPGGTDAACRCPAQRRRGPSALCRVGSTVGAGAPAAAPAPEPSSGGSIAVPAPSPAAVHLAPATRWPPLPLLLQQPHSGPPTFPLPSFPFIPSLSLSLLFIYSQG